MIGYPWGALITGLMLLLASGFTLGRHFLLEPLCKHYPEAPAYVRHVMFAFGVALCFIGLNYLFVFFSDAPKTIPPQPGPGLQLLSSLVMLYNGALFWNLLQQASTKAPLGKPVK